MERDLSSASNASASPPPSRLLVRTQTYSPGFASQLPTAPGSVLKPERKTERSNTALDASLFALLDDLTEIVRHGGPMVPHEDLVVGESEAKVPYLRYFLN